MPVHENIADVVISNCMLNLKPNKQAVFKKIYRVLKVGGRFCISDIVLTSALPPKLQTVAEMYAGCIAGASLKNDYIGYIRQAGFNNKPTQKENPITLPDDILENYLSKEEVMALKTRPAIVYSIIVYAEKILSVFTAKTAVVFRMLRWQIRLSKRYNSHNRQVK